MKTTKIFSVLSLALIFSAVTSAYSAAIDQKNIPVSTNRAIQYQVNIVLPGEKPLCNNYLVEILDGNGRLVAPAKPYSSRVSNYDFFERGPVSGVRKAVLVKCEDGFNSVCDAELITAPAILTGLFLNGHIYRFILYPTTLEQKQ